MAFFGGINTNTKGSSSSKSLGSPGQRNKKTSSNKKISGGGGSSKKSSSSKLNKEQKNILKDLDKAQKNLDKKESKTSTTTGTTTGTTLPGSSTTNTKDFLDDLKDAYKAGLFTGGTKAKALMSKYGLTGDQIRDLRVGIDQGLGTVISSSDQSKIGSNVLKDLVGDLRQEGILTTASRSPEFLQQRAGEIYEPGMKKSNMFLPYEDPQNIFETGANLSTQFNPFLNITSGIFGSSAGQRGDYYGRNVLGLEGEELDNFAASVANDRDFYNQMMKTPEMQNYELNEFRAEANRNMRASKGDPDPISGSQGGEGGEGGEGDGSTDPGSGTVPYTPAPQNYYTFFDPTLGKYRSGTYDEYLQYVTAKDGGIIQLENGGMTPNAPGGALPQGRKTQLEDLFEARREIQNLNTPTDSEAEGSRMIIEEIDDKAKELSDKSKEGIMMAMMDQPAKNLLAANNPDMGPALREDLSLMGKIKDSGMSLLMEALRKSDISTGSANQFIEEALNNFVAAGIIPPNTSYDQLTDPFKDLVTSEARKIAEAENMRAQEIGFEDPQGRGNFYLEKPVYKMIEGMPEDLQQMKPFMQGPTQNYTDRPLTGINTPDIRMLEAANGGIIGLKEGGMNDMMQADSLMFNDPSDEGQWEYNV